MSELRPAAAPPRNALLRTLADHLGGIVPGWRPIATGILGESGRIDLVGITDAGHALVVAVGDDEQDLLLVARALAHQAWLAPRLRDWCQLAPNLGLAPDAHVEALVLCPEPGPEARSAAATLAPLGLRLGRYRFVANGAASEVLLDLVDLSSRADPAPAAPTTAPQTAPFRTGLSDADLGLSDEERSEFE